MAKLHTLDNTERLKSRKLIDQVFRQGKSFVVFPYRVYYLFADTIPGPLQAGFTVSSKNFKKAVDRNRIKRLMREGYRLQKKDLETGLIRDQKKMAVFFLYIGKELPAWEGIKEKLMVTLKKLSAIAHENFPENT